MATRRRKPTLRLTITAALGLVALATAALISWLYYRSSRQMLLESARTLVEQVSERIGERARAYLGPVKNTSLICARLAESGQLRPDDLAGIERLFFAFLREYHRLKLIEFGDERGNHVAVWRNPDDSLSTRTTVRERGEVRTEWRERNPNAGFAEVRATRVDRNDPYDPRERSWYRDALRAEGVHWTDIYVPSGSRDPVVAAAITLGGPDGKRFGVASTAMSIEEIDSFLGTIRLGQTGKVFLVDRGGRLVGFPDLHERLVVSGTERGVPLLSTSGDRELQALAATPDLAHALATETAASLFRFEAGGRACYATVLPLAYRVADGWFVGAVLPEDDFLGALKRTAARTLLLALAVTSLATLVAVLVGRRISGSLQGITEETRRIRRLEFDGRLLADSPFQEISEILQAYGSMKTGLRAFQKYVPVKLVRMLLETSEDPRLGGRAQELTMLFSDIRSFSTLAESLDPQEVADRLGAYLGLLAETITARQGTVDKYIGDAVMAFWNAPRPVEDHAAEAVVTALECLEALRRIDPEDHLHTRIGIHTAEVMVGNFGSADRLSYTVIGDGVNLASRLEGINKHYGTQIIISDETYRRVAERFECRKLDLIAAKGRSKPTAIYEVMGRAGDVDAARVARARLYEGGLEAYLARRFDEARAAFDRVLAEQPDDVAAHELGARARAYSATPPSADWSGVHEMTTK